MIIVLLKVILIDEGKSTKLREYCKTPGGGGGRLGFILDGMCELNFFKRPISKVFNMLKLYP